MKYTLVNQDGKSSVTAFMPDGTPLVADDTHKNFKKIVDALLGDKDSEYVHDLFDIAQAISKRFSRLSERVTARNGEIYVDGDPVKSGITKKINDFLDNNSENWQPLVNFLEKVYANPEKHSREQLYDWLDKHNFVITNDGDIVAYKGLKKNADGTLTSTRQGPAIVDGEEVLGYVPNGIGSVVEMPRASVQHDPNHGCSTGLHVGTPAHARQFGTVVEVHVNPRDVVSVPTHSNWEKMRVCRYTVVKMASTTNEAKLAESYKDDGEYF